MALDVDAARAAIDREVAGPLGLDVIDAAWGIERIVNTNMANATRRVLAGYGADPRDLALIAYGGNGAVHAAPIATELGVDRILVPRAAPAFSALGLLVADYVVDIVRSYVTPLSRVDLGRLRDLVRELGDAVDKELEPADLAAADVTRQLFLQMAYAGQNFDMSVPCPEGETLDAAGLLDLADRFHDQHERDRGFAFRNQEPVVRGARLMARGETPKPEQLAPTVAAATVPTASRPVYFGTDWIDTPVHAGPAVATGKTIVGPALVEEPFTVVVVPPGWSTTLADHAAYELRR
jgi:N-methylhydantoinase A